MDEVPGLFIGWGQSWTSASQTHAEVYGGDIYSHPYDIPYSPGQNIYLCYSPGVEAYCVYDPNGVSERFLREYGDPDHYVLAGEQDRFYQWGFNGSAGWLTGWGEKVFINLLHHAVRP